MGLTEYGHITAFEWVRDGAISRWVLCSKPS